MASRERVDDIEARLQKVKGEFGNDRAYLALVDSMKCVKAELEKQKEGAGGTLHGKQEANLDRLFHFFLSLYIKPKMLWLTCLSGLLFSSGREINF